VKRRVMQVCLSRSGQEALDEADDTPR
jgi:hypothetical protein